MAFTIFFVPPQVSFSQDDTTVVVDEPTDPPTGDEEIDTFEDAINLIKMLVDSWPGKGAPVGTWITWFGSLFALLGGLGAFIWGVITGIKGRRARKAEKQSNAP